MSLMKRWAIFLSREKWHTATEEQRDAWLWFVEKLTKHFVTSVFLIIMITLGALMIVS